MVAPRARAVKVWLPGVAPVVFQLTVYGAEVSSAPRFAPSRRNCTPATPTLSDALAEPTKFVSPAMGMPSPISPVVHSRVPDVPFLA